MKKTNPVSLHHIQHFYEKLNITGHCLCVCFLDYMDDDICMCGSVFVRVQVLTHAIVASNFSHAVKIENIHRIVQNSMLLTSTVHGNAIKICRFQELFY